MRAIHSSTGSCDGLGLIGSGAVRGGGAIARGGLGEGCCSRRRSSGETLIRLLELLCANLAAYGGAAKLNVTTVPDHPRWLTARSGVAHIGLQLAIAWLRRLDAKIKAIGMNIENTTRPGTPPAPRPTTIPRTVPTMRIPALMPSAERQSLT
jgi:hypothetical protein